MSLRGTTDLTVDELESAVVLAHRDILNRARKATEPERVALQKASFDIRHRIRDIGPAGRAFAGELESDAREQGHALDRSVFAP